MNAPALSVWILKPSCMSMHERSALRCSLFHTGNFEKDMERIILQYILTKHHYRTSLVRHHEFLLRFDGEGHYEFRE